MAVSLPSAVLCLITDRTLFGSAPAPPEILLVEAVDAALRGGVNMVQLREKDLPARELLSLAHEFRKVTRGRAMFVVNDRVDVALAAEADGVQLGEQSISVAAARQVCGAELVIGRSVHDLYGALDAERDGADFLVAGTIFSSGSHPGIAPAGPKLIKEIGDEASIPIIGVGGINPGNAGRVVAAGARGVAVIGAILSALDPRAAASDLLDAVGSKSARAADGTAR